jgi:hypothetical protein
VQSADVRPSSAPGSPLIKQGLYTLPLGNARQRSSACLARNNESLAWACIDSGTLRVEISTSPSSQAEDILLSLDVLGNSDQTIYGQQPSEIVPTEVFPFEDDESDNRPLYKFKTAYNRTVLLQESQLPWGEQITSSTTSVERTAITPKERPWLCFFNETTIEGYIYAPRDSTLTASANLSGTLRAPRFPYILKLADQRSPSGTQPYCERRKVSEDGQLVPDGESKYLLSLSEPTFLLANVPSTRHRRQQTPSANSCRCEWICKHSD